MDSKGEHDEFAKKFLAAMSAKVAAEAEERHLAGKAHCGGGSPPLILKIKISTKAGGDLLKAN